MLEDGTILTLDQLCDDLGLDRLPYLEDMPDELDLSEAPEEPSPETDLQRYHEQVRAKVLEGLDDSKAGRLIDHENLDLDDDFAADP